MVDIVQTSRIVQAICNCDTPARPVILPARCIECSAMLVAVGTPVWVRLFHSDRFDQAVRP
jgi:hypothetical protein